MKFKVKGERIQKLFEKVMEPYYNLDHSEKSYDYWVHEKGGYVDWDVLNFYHNIEEDYEDDDWVMQYQYEPGDEGNEESLPILRYGSGYSFGNVELMFGPYFEELLKDWFEKTYDLKVKTIEKN